MHLCRHTVQVCGCSTERHVLALDREGRGQGCAQVHTWAMTGLRGLSTTPSPLPECSNPQKRMLNQKMNEGM